MKYAKIKTVHEAGKADVYNLEVPFFHNFIANGIVVHNCADAIRYFIKTKKIVTSVKETDEYRSVFF